MSQKITIGGHKTPPPKSSWWATWYPDRCTWYAAAAFAAERLKGAKSVTPSDYAPGRFGEAWKKPKTGERRYSEEDMEQVA